MGVGEADEAEGEGEPESSPEVMRRPPAPLGPDVPILQTLFSPLTVAHKLSLHLSFEESVRDHRERLEAGLRAIVEGSRRFATATLDAAVRNKYPRWTRANTTRTTLPPKA